MYVCLPCHAQVDGRDQVCALFVWILTVCLFVAYSLTVLTQAWAERNTPQQSLRYLDVFHRKDLDIFPNLVNLSSSFGFLAFGCGADELVVDLT